MKPYDWRGLWNIPSYRGKLKRIVAQFGPHSWLQFDWRPFSSFERWISTLLIIISVIFSEIIQHFKFYLILLPI